MSQQFKIEWKNKIKYFSDLPTLIFFSARYQKQTYILFWHNWLFSEELKYTFGFCDKGAMLLLP